MFKRTINYDKLRSKLGVSIQRIDSMLKRKKARALKKRKEIIHLVRIQKKKKARTCVEQIIPIDCLIEAGDILKQLCTLLIERFDSIQKSDFLEGNLIEAIYCVIWAAPFLKHEVDELETVAHLLNSKFGRLCKSFAHKNVVYENLKKKLILARSGQWLSPKTIQDYLIQLTKHYESREEKGERNSDPQIPSYTQDPHPKNLSPGDRWRIGLQTISQPPRISNNDGKVGYRRSSVGTYVNERPWMTLKVPANPAGNQTKNSESITIDRLDRKERLSRIPRPTSVQNSTLLRSNSLNNQYRKSMTSVKSLSGSLTSLKSSNRSLSSSTSILAEEYVSILDSLFNFDNNASKGTTLEEEPDTSIENDSLDVSNGDVFNWGKFDMGQ